MDAMPDFGTLTHDGDHVEMRFERHYPRRAETVWAALTEPARLADWFSPALVEARAGGRYELFKDRDEQMLGRIRVWQPPHLLELSWTNDDAPNSVVRWELAPETDGTRVVFTHSGVRFAATARMMPGWHTFLERLGHLLDDAQVPLDMDRYLVLQGEYVAHHALAGVRTGTCEVPA